MATPSPSPSLHLSDADLPGEPQDPVHAEPCCHLCKLSNTSSSQDQLQDVGSSSWEMEEPTSTGDLEDEDGVVEYRGTDVVAVEELPDFEMEATVGSGMPPYKLQDVRSSSWGMKEPTSTGDCEDEDDDVEEVVEYNETDAAAVEEQDELPDFEMEATVSSWEMEEPMSTGDCEDEDDDVEEVVEYNETDAAAVEEQDELPDLEMGATAGSGKPQYKLQDVGSSSYAAVAEEQDELPDFEMEATVGSGKPPYKLPARILNKLYPHQREGLSWLWSLHCRGTGGILGDMGLGKTMQVSAFLAGLFHSGLIRRVLVVAPQTILTDWIKELSIVGLRHKISNYSGPNKDARHYGLQHAFKEGGIFLTTYDMVRVNYKQIRGDFYDGEGDEWFRVRYALPINQGNDKSASNRAKHIGSNVAKELRERIKPYFLRRMKSEVSLGTGLTDDKQLPKKNELIIWLKLTDRQRQLYKAFLKCELVHLAASRGNPLAAITVLKQICDHPQIVTKRAAEHILEGMDGILNNQETEMAENNNKEMEMAEKMAMNLADMAHDDEAVEVGPEVSCKLSFILALLRNLLEEEHHVLIFSHTRKMLNLIQEAILLESYSFLRMDGSTEISERERIVKDFQEGLGAQIFLLTTKVGGLGLALTKAARVIVVDPAWNPSTDNQSVDRDIKDLFSLPEQGFDVSLTQKQLQEEHGHPLDT
ncbi:hypothetical protein ACQ4PT_044690 [Festuca glaucescens]